MLINTRYSTIYNIQRSQAIKAINENEENRNSGRSFSANLQDAEEEYKDSKNSIVNNLVTKDINSSIENIKFFSGGDEARIKFAIKELYEADSTIYAIKTSNFLDVSEEVEEIKNSQLNENVSEGEDFGERGVWYDSNDFEKSLAYRETIEDNILEENILKIKNKKENDLSKEDFLLEIEQERFEFKNRRVI